MKWATIMARVAFGVMWVWAGVPKLIDPRGFLVDVRGYDLLVDPWAVVVALGLPWLEVFVGLAVIFGKWLYRGALWISGGMLGVFLVGILSAWIRGLDIECGCFGSGGEKGQYLWWTVRDLLLLAWWGVLMRWGASERKTRRNSTTL